MITEDTKMALQASGEEVDALRLVRNQLSEPEFIGLQHSIFSNFITNQRVLDSVVTNNTHAYELTMLLKMREEQWYSEGIKYFCDSFRYAMQNNQEETLKVVEDNYGSIHEALSSHSDAFFLQKSASFSKPKLKVRAYFRMLGDMLESVHFSHIQMIYKVLILCDNSTLFKRPSRVSNGKAVSELSSLDEFNEAFVGFTDGISLNQLRNISQHSSYKYNEERQLIECTYGNNQCVELTVEQLEVILVKVDVIQVFLKTCLSFSLINHEEVSSILLRQSLTLETLMSQLGNLFALHNYQVFDVDETKVKWHIKIKDIHDNGVKKFKLDCQNYFFPLVYLLSKKGVKVVIEMFNSKGKTKQKAELSIR
ncbi:TPA: hypothetical protein RQJ48_004466 [Vibrio vulnificus]|nr:hypothetical protein [Vibrio vulnificus]HDY7484275.1 hypothetical protein [Vibrio vulnificus]